jgi:hypothetical protein
MEEHVSSEFEDQLRATMERELSPAYLADDNPHLARYQALAASRAAVRSAGRWMSAAAPATRLRLAALLVVGAVVLSGAAVADASRSSQGLILPLLQRAAGHHQADTGPSTAAPANPAVQVSDAARTSAGSEPGHSSSAPAGAAAPTKHSDDHQTPAFTAPRPSPEQEIVPPDAGHERDGAPKPGCSPSPSPTLSGASPEEATPHTPDARPADLPTPESSPPAHREHCG